MSFTGGMMNPMEYREMVRSVIYEGKMPPKKRSTGKGNAKTAPAPQAPPPSAVRELMEMRRQMQQQAEAAVK